MKKILFVMIISLSFQATGDIVAYACNEIVLGDGFHAQLGSKFHAYVYCDGCTRPIWVKSGELGGLNETNETHAPREVVNTFSDDKKEIEVVVYPNPSSGEITIDIGEKVKNAQYHLFDLLGNLLKGGNLEETKSTLALQLEKGFFILQISNNGKQTIKKIQLL